MFDQELLDGSKAKDSEMIRLEELIVSKNQRQIIGLQ